MSSRRTGLLLTLLAGAFPAPARAQLPGAGTYRVYQGTAELSRETFRFAGDTLDHEALVPAVNLRVQSRTTFGASGSVRTFQMTVMNAAGDSTRGSYEVVAVGDSLRITSRLGRSTREAMRLGPARLVIPPQSTFPFIALMREAGRDSITMVLVAGADTVLPVSTTQSGDSVQLGFAGLVMQGVRQHGSVAVLTIPAQRVRSVLVLPGDSLPPMTGLRRPAPDYTAPAGAAWTAEEVRVPAGTARDTFSLGCTLTRPARGRTSSPAAVTITGSGLQTRDEELWPLVRGYRPFGEIAERLAIEGIATLRCDDRSVGSSGGRADSATSADLAEDTDAQLRWLRRQPGIDSKRLALIGHSEGGLIGPLLAVRDRSLAALVLLAAPAKNGTEILVDQMRWPIQVDPTLSEVSRVARLREVEEATRADTLPASPWLRWFRRYEPLETARRVRQPTLILQGALDRQISAGQADTLAQAIRSNGNRRVEVEVFPGLNHLFLRSGSDGSPSEYSALTDVHLPAAVIDRLAGWLAATLATTPGR